MEAADRRQATTDYVSGTKTRPFLRQTPPPPFPCSQDHFGSAVSIYHVCHRSSAQLAQDVPQSRRCAIEPGSDLCAVFLSASMTPSAGKPPPPLILGPPHFSQRPRLILATSAKPTNERKESANASTRLNSPQSNTNTDRATFPPFMSAKASLISSSGRYREISSSSLILPCLYRSRIHKKSTRGRAAP